MPKIHFLLCLRQNPDCTTLQAICRSYAYTRAQSRLRPSGCNHSDQSSEIRCSSLQPRLTSAKCGMSCPPPSGHRLYLSKTHRRVLRYPHCGLQTPARNARLARPTRPWKRNNAAPIESAPFRNACPLACNDKWGYICSDRTPRTSR